MLLALLSACTFTIDFDDKPGDDSGDPADTDVTDPTDTGGDDDTGGPDTDDTDDDDDATVATTFPLAEDHWSMWVWAHDVTGDGVDDLLALSIEFGVAWEIDGQPVFLNLVRGAGDDRYFPLETYAVGHNIQNGADLSFGDVDGDGFDDVAVGHADGFTVFPGGPDGLGTPRDVPGGNALGVVLADVDLDGVLDATACSPEGTFMAWAGDGAGGFIAYQTGPCAETSVTRPRGVVADLDGDGWPDHLRRVLYGDSATETLEVMWNEGGTFAPGRRYALPDDGIHESGAAPYDFGVVHSDLSPLPLVLLPIPGSYTLSAYGFRDRGLSFAYSFGDAPGQYHANVLVGDADRDGETDVVIPETVGGDGFTNRNEAAFYRSYGGTRTAYFRGEWEMTGNLTTYQDHGYDLVTTAERDGLVPLVMVHADTDYVWSIRIIEPEAEL